MNPATYDRVDGRPRRRLSAAERRALIFEAALQAFAAKGYEGAAMDEIAAAAGVSKAVVYDHVRSKRELYLELLESIRHDLMSTVEEAIRTAAPGGEAHVRAAVEAFFGYVDEHRNGCRLLLRELESVNISEIGRQLEERISGRIAASLQAERRLLAGHPEREQHAKILAELLKSAVLGAAGWWLLHAEIPREHVVERAAAVVWPALVHAAGVDA